MKILRLWAMAIGLILILSEDVTAQVPITASGDTALINFSGFEGLGFSPSPAPGELSSNTWAVQGETDSLVFGGTRNTPGTIFARGVVGTNQLSAGIYAYSRGTDTLMMLQPTGASYSPGNITLRIQNNTGSTLTAIYFGFHFFIRNDGGRGNSFNLLHSPDNVNYSTIPSLDYTSPDAIADTNILDIGIRQVLLSGLSVAPGAFYHFRWYTTDVSGSGNRDEFFLDDIKIVGIAGPVPNLPPTITSVSRSSFVPEHGTPAIVSARITDDHALAGETLFFSVNGVFDSLSMTSAGVDSFTAVIPGDSNLNGNLITYYVKAYDDSGGVSTSTSFNYFAGVTPIATLRQNDGNGVNLFNGYPARIAAIVTAETDIFSTTARDFQVQDADRGINVFINNTSLPTVVRGDSVVVEGTIGQFNGKLEITTPGLSYATISSGHVVEPVTVIVSQMSEDLEGTLVRIENATKTSGTWPATGNNSTLYISDNGGIDSTGLFVDRDTDMDGSPEPTYPATWTGIASQFDASSPFTGGYQIVPRDLNDIDENDDPFPSQPISPADQSTIVVSDTSTGGLEFLWTASADPEGSPVTHTLWIDSSLTYGATAWSIASGNGGFDTTLTISLVDIKNYVAGLGLSGGESIDLYWRVVSSDGPNEAASASYTLETALQLTDFAPSAFHLLAPPDGSRLVSSPTSQDTTWFVWNASVDPEGQNVTYLFEIDVSSNFATSYVEIRADSAFPGDHAGLDYFLADLGVLPGDSIVLYWRVTAMDEFLHTISLDTFSFMAVRGFSSGSFISFLQGSSEIPPVMSSGFGFGEMVLSQDSTVLRYQLGVAFLNSPPTAMSFNQGASYESGPSVRDLDFTMEADSGDTVYLAEGFWTSVDGQPLTTALVSELLEGRLYVNVVTASAPNGEVRGQIVSDTLIFGFSAADNLSASTGDGLAHLDWELIDATRHRGNIRRNLRNRQSTFVRMVSSRKSTGLNDGTIIGFNVYRSTGADYELVEFTGDTATTYVDSTVSVGTTYYYMIGAVHEWGITSPSNVAAISPVVPVDSRESKLPDRYDLHANFPNPFNPVTTIRYDLKAEGVVSLNIYNLLGQKVRTLVESRQSAGFKTVDWDGRNDAGQQVATGIYLYRLDAGDFVRTRKMLLIK